MLVNLLELSIEIIWMKLSKQTERINPWLQEKIFFSCDCDYLESTEY